MEGLTKELADKHWELLYNTACAPRPNMALDAVSQLIVCFVLVFNMCHSVVHQVKLDVKGSTAPPGRWAYLHLNKRDAQEKNLKICPVL